MGINPRFAFAVTIVLALIGFYVGYLMFGSAVAQMLRPVAAITSPATDSASLPGEVAASMTPGTAPEEAPTSPPVEAPTEAPVVPPPAPTDTVAPVEPPATPTSEPAVDYSATVKGKYYDAYIPDVATKTKQYYHYTCEFDAAWVVLKSNGIDASLQDQIDIAGLDTSIEPYYKETANGAVIYGGDIFNYYSGDYDENFLARSTGLVMRKVFEHYGLKVTAVNTREGLEAALRRGELVWIKATADFKPGRVATWVLPDGTTYETVLGNDHAAVVMGYSERGALIRDVLGPTNTNWNREYEYELPWEKFMVSWGQQQYDGLAVSKP
jgi:hypothetical protein